MPMVGSLTTTLPSSFREVDGNGANAAGDGKGGTKLSYTMTLLAPLASDTVELGYTAKVVDAVAPPATVSALPVNPLDNPTLSNAAKSYKGGAETGEKLAAGASTIDSNLLKLRDGASDLLAGLIKLRDGADKLSTGLQEEAAPGARKLADGAGDLNDGLGELDAGAGKLADGTQDLRDGTGKLSDGAGKLNDGAGKLAAGAGKASVGSGDLAEGLDGLLGGLKDLKAGVDALPASVKSQLAANEQYIALVGKPGPQACWKRSLARSALRPTAPLRRPAGLLKKLKFGLSNPSCNPAILTTRPTPVAYARGLRGLPPASPRAAQAQTLKSYALSVYSHRAGAQGVGCPALVDGVPPNPQSNPGAFNIPGVGQLCAASAGTYWGYVGTISNAQQGAAVLNGIAGKIGTLADAAPGGRDAAGRPQLPFKGVSMLPATPLRRTRMRGTSAGFRRRSTWWTRASRC